jgi:hypothetical protein
MDFFFADDSTQAEPPRPGMGALTAIGGVHVPGPAVAGLERRIDEICRSAGFPDGQEFKWSPAQDLWMRRHLPEAPRQSFFRSVLEACAKFGARAIVVVEDTTCRTATDATSPLLDLTRMFIERVDGQLKRSHRHGVIIADRPSGGPSQDTKFLASCLETLQQGTAYVKPECVAINVLSTPSHLVRLLQVADLVTSCTTAHVAGRYRYARPLFVDWVHPLLHRGHGGRVGGYGLKLHPGYRYLNLYHWLLGDRQFGRNGAYVTLPDPERWYPSSADELR